MRSMRSAGSTEALADNAWEFEIRITMQDRRFLPRLAAYKEKFP